MELESVWRQFFVKWPADIERRGILVTSLNEQIPFDSFAVSESLVMLDRRTPDTLGARKVVVPFQNVAAVKITDVVKIKSFHVQGFEETSPAKK